MGLLLVISALLVAVGAFGIYTANEGLRSVYENRTVAIQSLSTLDNRLQEQSAVLTEASLDPANSNPKVAIAQNLQRKREIDNVWKQFRARPLTPSEVTLAGQYERLYAELRDTAFKPLEKALDFGDPVTAGAIVYNNVHVMLPKVKAALQDLKNLEVSLANAEYHLSAERARMLSAILLFTSAAGLLGATVFGVIVARNLYAQLGGEPRYAATLLRKLASGQLAINVNVSARDKGSLLLDLRHMRDALAETVGNIRTASQSVAIAADEIASGNNDLSQRTETQAGNLERTSHRIKELTVTVSKNAADALSATKLALDAVAATANGGQAVSSAVTSMRAVSEASSRMSSIVATIQSIAFQTNILALNAAVESARAGHHGRGFAVVAGEVRTLAQRSADAASEVKVLIQETLQRVQLGAEQVERAGATMSDIQTSVHQVSTLVDEIAHACREQSEGLQGISLAAQDMEHTTQQNAALVEQAAAAASSLREQSGILESAVGRFTVSANTR
ncbi:chemotaxis protein [Pandoraea terrae]|uniref:Chemotaxis protein n=1 Tax=Pandoraea terrae TaxID=1537710 RepID=A0A5E4WY79_9BURK|nr:chemotaxis protein [Pandoraea terrae]